MSLQKRQSERSLTTTMIGWTAPLTTPVAASSLMHCLTSLISLPFPFRSCLRSFAFLIPRSTTTASRITVASVRSTSRDEGLPLFAGDRHAALYVARTGGTTWIGHRHAQRHLFAGRAAVRASDCHDAIPQGTVQGGRL